MSSPLLEQAQVRYAAWEQQREQCRQCDKFEPRGTAMYCRARPKPQMLRYCIDERMDANGCGPAGVFFIKTAR